MPWQIDPEPSYYGVALRFSPDGKLLYVFGNEVTILDAATMEQVDTWDLSLPAESAMGRFDPGPWDDSADPPRLRHRLVHHAGRGDEPQAAGGRARSTWRPRPWTPSSSAPCRRPTASTSPSRPIIGARTSSPPRSATTSCGPSTWMERRVTNRAEVPTRTRMQMRIELDRPAVPLRGRPDDRGVSRPMPRRACAPSSSIPT